MKPVPPLLPADGCTTARVNPTATAASTALPPFLMISTPTSLAIGWIDDTIPWRSGTGMVSAKSGQSPGIALSREPDFTCVTGASLTEVGTRWRFR